MRDAGAMRVGVRRVDLPHVRKDRGGGVGACHACGEFVRGALRVQDPRDGEEGNLLKVRGRGLLTHERPMSDPRASLAAIFDSALEEIDILRGAVHLARNDGETLVRLLSLLLALRHQERTVEYERAGAWKEEGRARASAALDAWRDHVAMRGALDAAADRCVAAEARLEAARAALPALQALAARGTPAAREAVGRMAEALR